MIRAHWRRGEFLDHNKDSLAFAKGLPQESVKAVSQNKINNKKKYPTPSPPKTNNNINKKTQNLFYLSLSLNADKI